MDANLLMPFWFTLLLTVIVGPVTMLYALMTKMVFLWSLVYALWNLVYSLFTGLLVFLTQLAVVSKNLANADTGSLTRVIHRVVGTTCFNGVQWADGVPTNKNCTVKESEQILNAVVKAVIEPPANSTDWADSITKTFPSMWQVLGSLFTTAREL